ncbi:hypothetical protein Y032_0174g472 [Ancylostoma ceylanicum]|uniref:Uncharacterized protein n=1 Tax=Ancylostoma ceylanicum TaxID=53326 RepID=A0A016SUL6_9BILA|nr:hypothetical protein Y032_0174g472 [Ancylostoma ceylanicum]
MNGADSPEAPKSEQTRLATSREACIKLSMETDASAVATSPRAKPSKRCGCARCTKIAELITVTYAFHRKCTEYTENPLFEELEDPAATAATRSCHIGTRSGSGDTDKSWGRGAGLSLSAARIQRGMQGRDAEENRAAVPTLVCGHYNFKINKNSSRQTKIKRKMKKS